MFKPVDTVK